jgi:hypothetical protein
MLLFRGEISCRVMKWKLFIMLKTRGSHNGAEEDAGFLGHENLRGAIAPKIGALVSVTSNCVAPSVFIR